MPGGIQHPLQRQSRCHAARSETAEGRRIGGLAADQVRRAPEDDTCGGADVIPRGKRHDEKLQPRGERLCRKAGRFSRVRQRGEGTGRLLGGHQRTTAGQREQVTSPLRILLLEDNSRDAELVQELLEVNHFGCEVTRVQTRAEFIAGLENAGINLILADYSLPSFDGLSALTLARDARPDVPFIFVSGTLGEEVAIEAVKIGATDYVVKSRLSRLVPSVQRALREARERAARKKAEEALRQSEMCLAEAQRLSHTGSFGWDPASGEIYWSDETYRTYECDPTITPTVELVLDRTHPDDRLRLRQIIERASTERSEFIAEHRLLMADGSVKFVRAVARASTAEDRESFVFLGAVTDITERKRAEEERERLHRLEDELAHMNRVSMMG